MYLVRGLLNALQEYPWDENSDAKCKIYMNAVCLLCASSQVYCLFTRITQGGIQRWAR